MFNFNLVKFSIYKKGNILLWKKSLLKKELKCVPVAKKTKLFRIFILRLLERPCNVLHVGHLRHLGIRGKDKQCMRNEPSLNAM